MEKQGFLNVLLNTLTGKQTNKGSRLGTVSYLQCVGVSGGGGGGYALFVCCAILSANFTSDGVSRHNNE